ncbi:MAG: GNAT family N-acetyltransferase [Terriglobia bacterium]|jgi:GNAT superfamily N-acetyltransferase|nr:GNAT family N-acetyltransferase [Terriglobia bacterium]
MQSCSVQIRECRLSDAESIAQLSAQLGYPVPADEMERRLRHVTDDPGHGVLVACIEDSQVVGWIDVGIVFHLQSGAYCEIGGLVVAESVRSNGIGRELVAAGERWAASRAVKKVLVRSNAIRADAHRFYLREDYTMVKTSAVFEKRL